MISMPRKYLEMLLSHEGGYSNNPNDTGGETKYGISKRAYPMVDIKNLTPDDVYVIYNRDYWLPIADATLAPPAVVYVLFDFAVNSGVSAALKALQRAVNVAADGKVGPITRQAMTKYSTRELILAIQEKRKELIRTLVVKGKLHPSFEKGILARIDRVTKEALT